MDWILNLLKGEGIMREAEFLSSDFTSTSLSGGINFLEALKMIM